MARKQWGAEVPNMKIVETRVEMDVPQNQVTLQIIPENNAMNQNANLFVDLMLFFCFFFEMFSKGTLILRHK